MKNNRCAFDEYNIDPEITAYTIFDIRLWEDFCRKSRFVGDGYKVDAPSSITYSSVVSRDSVQIIVTITVLNKLELLGANIQYAFLTAP